MDAIGNHFLRGTYLCDYGARPLVEMLQPWCALSSLADCGWEPPFKIHTHGMDTCYDDRVQPDRDCGLSSYSRYRDLWHTVCLQFLSRLQWCKWMGKMCVWYVQMKINLLQYAKGIVRLKIGMRDASGDEYPLNRMYEVRNLMGKFLSNYIPFPLNLTIKSLKQTKLISHQAQFTN